MYLNGIEKYNFGGTCYPINYYFNLLLNHLGFDVKLCGADMRLPDVHMLNLVLIESIEYIVDPAFAAPFFSPMPRSLNEDFIVTRGVTAYRIKPQDERKRTTIEQYENDEFIMSFRAKPEPRKIHEFADVIEDSFSEKSTFINSLFLTRHYEDKTVAIYNLKFKKHSGIITKIYEIKNREELIETVHREFGMPVNIIAPVLKEMSKLEDELSKT